MKQEMMGGSGISWTICKSFAPHSRQITTPAPHHSVFTGRMPFLPPNQQCQSTEGNGLRMYHGINSAAPKHNTVSLKIIIFSGKVKKMSKVQKEL